MQLLLILIILLTGYKILKKRRLKEITPIEIRENDLIYQYIVDAHCLVINTVGMDPLRDPVKFQKVMAMKTPILQSKIEDLRARYIETIARDTEFGRTLQNYDFWRQRRNAWIVKKKNRLDVAQRRERL